MPDKRPSKTPLGSEGTPDYQNVTVEQARVMRADQARRAAVYATRSANARAAYRHGAMLRWEDEYRRCAARCRLLGERIRQRPAGSPSAGADHESTVVPFTRRRVRDAPPTGEAA
jgi:hypothetical protein